MKQICFKHLQSLVIVALCVVMAVAFNSCSSDDDEKSANDNLSSVVVGTWAQDENNDILVIKADGTGIAYNNATDYKNNDIYYRFKWEYKNKWFYIISDDVYSCETMRVTLLSKDKIVWQRYDEGASSGSGYEHDAFGYYELWTWERYTR